MKQFIVVNTVDGSVSGVFPKATNKEANDCAARLAVEQGDIDLKSALEEVKRDGNILTNNGTVEIVIFPVEVPDPPKTKPTLKGGKKFDPDLLTIEVPLLVTCTTGPEEMEDREDKRKPSKRSLVDWMGRALAIDFDLEDEGHPDGAAFIASGVDWSRARLIKG